jgi:hypothetical protein
MEILADAGVGLLVARAALPIVLTWLTNLAIRKELPGYRGKVQRVDSLWGSESWSRASHSLNPPEAMSY